MLDPQVFLQRTEPDALWPVPSCWSGCISPFANGEVRTCACTVRAARADLLLGTNESNDDARRVAFSAPYEMLRLQEPLAEGPVFGTHQVRIDGDRLRLSGQRPRSLWSRLLH